MGRAADVVSELLVPEPLEHSVLMVPLEVGDGSVDNTTVLDPLEHSGDVRSRYPLIFQGCTRERPGMEEVVRGTIGVKIVHSRTSGTGPAGRCGGHCRRGCRLGGSMVSRCREFGWALVPWWNHLGV